MTVDPLSDVLSLVDAQSVVTGVFAASGSWSMFFTPRNLKFYACTKGSCWLVREGQKEPRRIEAGDVLLITDRQRFILASDLTIEPQDVAAVFASTVGNIASLGTGDEFSILAGHVALDPIRGGLLLESLPPVIYFRSASPQTAAVHHLLLELDTELRSERAGGRLAASMLTQLVFLHALRAYLDDRQSASPRWLDALGDERIGPALRDIHGEPGHPWTLEELARSCSMSRSAFAQHFKEVAGIAPLSYLTHWRMRLAQKALIEGRQTVSSVAYSLGYTSESSFSNAFKRVVGRSPARYREEGRKPGARSCHED